MKKSKFSETQIFKALDRNVKGERVEMICRELGISEPTFYNWKSRYGGMNVSELQRAKYLEEENSRLRKMIADQAITIDVLKEVNSKNW